MCRYIGDSNRTTPTKSAPTLTGSVTGDVSKNIYDLAGNCREYTMEAHPNVTRTVRGGYYSSAQGVYLRGAYNNDGRTSDNLAFRCTLYIK